MHRAPLVGNSMTEESCPACGGADLTWDGSCGGQLAKCMDCGAMVIPEKGEKKKPGC